MKSRMEGIYAALLEEIGEDPDREGLLKTPHRAAQAMRFVTEGYRQNLDEVVNGAVFHESSDDMVIIRDIEFYSLCEHHLLPFFGRVNIAYIPDGRIIGLSKLARITDMFARRLQVQERMTVEIANAIDQVLQPKGVAIVVAGKHLCMMARGVESQSSEMVTSHVLGCFRTDRAARAECMALLNRNR